MKIIYGIIVSVVLATASALFGAEKKAQENILHVRKYQQAQYEMPSDIQQRRAQLCSLIDDTNIFPDVIRTLIVGYLDRRGEFFRSYVMERRGKRCDLEKRVTAMVVLDDKHIVVGTNQCHMHVVDISLGRDIASEYAHADGISALTSLAQQKLLVSGSYDGTIKIWDVSNPQNIINKYTITNNFTAQDARVTALSSYGQFLAAGFLDGHLIIWNVKQDDGPEQVLYHLFPPEFIVSSLAYNPDGHLMIGAKGGALLRVIENVSSSIKQIDSQPIGHLTQLKNGLLAYLTAQGIKIYAQQYNIHSMPSFSLRKKDSPVCCVVDDEGRLIVGWKNSGFTVHNEQGDCLEEAISDIRESISTLAILPNESCITGGIYGSLSFYQRGIDIAGNIPCKKGIVLRYEKK
jgi:hypothetical protein